MQELKRCPFCNYNKISVVRLIFRYRRSSFVVKCNLCKTRGPWARTKEEAIEFWNLANRYNPETEMDAYLHAWLVMNRYILEGLKER